MSCCCAISNESSRRRCCLPRPLSSRCFPQRIPRFSTCWRAVLSLTMLISMQSSSGYSRILDIDRSACRRVPVLVFCSIILAVVGLCLSGLDWWLLAPGLLFVATTGCYEWLAAWPGSARCVTSIRVWPDGQFAVGLGPAPHTLESVTLTRSWTIPGFALGLAFVGHDRRRSQSILFRDQLPSQVWRLLRVRLRYGRG